MKNSRFHLFYSLFVCSLLVFFGMLNGAFRSAIPPQDAVPILEAVSFSFECARSGNSSSTRRPISGSVRKKYVDSLFIQFRLVGNEEVNEGIKNLYLLVVGPNGQTYTNLAQGMGGMVRSNSGEIAYSRKVFVGYRIGKTSPTSVPFVFESNDSKREGIWSVSITKGKRSASQGLF